jgi:predicted adenine nucleotide alpha hydrolase (AANH) superfamily ATPase
MKLLLHTCCGPCTTATVEWARGEVTKEVTGFFYNPNIHPENELQRRLRTMQQTGELLELPLICAGEEEGLLDYLQQVAFREVNRCRVCYAMRLAQAAKYAVKSGYDAFSTTLLISPYQNLEALQLIGHSLAKLIGPDFIFQDLRPRYPASRRLAKELGLYQQKYCGCIFSELERIQAKSRRVKESRSRGVARSPLGDRHGGPLGPSHLGSRESGSANAQEGLVMPRNNVRPFSLPGLEAEETEKLFAEIASSLSEKAKSWKPWSKG